MKSIQTARWLYLSLSLAACSGSVLYSKPKKQALPPIPSPLEAPPPPPAGGGPGGAGGGGLPPPPPPPPAGSGGAGAPGSTDDGDRRHRRGSGGNAVSGRDDESSAVYMVLDDRSAKSSLEYIFGDKSASGSKAASDPLDSVVDSAANNSSTQLRIRLNVVRS